MDASFDFPDEVHQIRSMELHKVTLHEPSSLKSAIDDEIVLHIEGLEFQPNHRVSNWKLIIGYICQFHFENSRNSG